MASPLGETIRRLRREKRLTLDELARLTESSKSWLWELENREAPRPSAEKLSRVAAALGVTTDFLTAAPVEGPDAGVLDEAFYRKYRQLDEGTRAKIRDLVERWSRDD
jgi:transcriptional regulator with XRE-family HTH domain